MRFFFARKYIQLNDALRERLHAFPESPLLNDFSKPLCLGVNEYDKSGRPPGEKAKVLFLLWFFQNYGLPTEHKSVFEATMPDFSLDAFTFSRYFLISGGTQIGRKITVNEDTFLKRELRLETLEAILLVDEDFISYWFGGLLEYKRNQHQSREAAKKGNS